MFINGCEAKHFTMVDAQGYFGMISSCSWTLNII